jgi:acyl carrier protein
MEKKIKKLMANIFEINAQDISNNMSPTDIDNWDSLRHLMLIVDLENEFQIKFNDDELVSLIDFATICQIISKKI